jgi:hypothetical protein
MSTNDPKRTSRSAAVNCTPLSRGWQRILYSDAGRRSPSTLLSSCNICFAGPLKSPSVGFASICSVLLFRAAIKVGALLNSERLMVNIANDMCLRLENHVAALDGPLNFTVNNHALSNDTSDDLGLRRHNECSALQVALYLTIDLD